MIVFLRRLLDTHLLAPHGFCFLWRPELLWTHVISDALIGVSYMTIPFALLVIIFRRRDIPFSWVIWCFAIFILACGMTHFMMIWTLWTPLYGVEGLVKVVTAVASVTTAILLWRLIPLATALASPEQLRIANERLELRIGERDAAIALLEEEQAEGRKTEEALLQAQKMDALGQLTGGLAHDFNNLLQAVQTSLELIDRRADDPASVRRLALGGLGATHRGAELTAKLLAFARKKQLSPETFNVDEMIAEMREILARTSGSSVDLRFELHADDAVVEADKTQAEVALLNLVNNARQATSEGGRILISSRDYEVVDAEPDLAPGIYVEVSVADNGAGMDPEIARKAFEPFFTTKPIGQGTGLGLSQVYGFANQAGGVARIESALGEGARVSLYIPRLPAARPEKVGTAVSAPTDLPLASTILLVDDDDHVRDTAVEMLGDLGLEVVEASSGPEALRLNLPERVSVAVLDYAMPEMTGTELAAHLRMRWPGLPVIFVTGYSDVGELRTLTGERETVLRKPYRKSDLRDALVGVLGSAGFAPTSSGGDAGEV